jgi:hypothetical protein
MKLLRHILEQAAQTGHEVVHHISPHDIDKFHPLTHFGTYKAARAVGSQLHVNDIEREFGHPSPEERERFHYKARLVNKGNTFHLSNDGSLSHTPDTLIHHLRRDGVLSHDEANNHLKHVVGLMSKHKTPNSQEAKEYVGNVIRSQGIHTLSYVNDIEHPGNKSYIITHPNQVHVIKKTKIFVKSNQIRDKTRLPARKA